MPRIARQNILGDIVIHSRLSSGTSNTTLCWWSLVVVIRNGLVIQPFNATWFSCQIFSSFVGGWYSFALSFVRGQRLIVAPESPYTYQFEHPIHSFQSKARLRGCHLGLQQAWPRQSLRRAGEVPPQPILPRCSPCPFSTRMYWTNFRKMFGTKWSRSARRPTCRTTVEGICRNPNHPRLPQG